MQLNELYVLADSDMQVSEEEIEFLTEGAYPYDNVVLDKLYHPNLKLLLVTEGSEGCRYYTKVGITASS